MKLPLVILLTFYFVSVHGLFGPKLQAKLWEREDNCLAETHDKPMSINRIRHFRKLPENGKLDKFAVCMLKSYHILNNDGTVNPDVQSHYLISDDGKKKQYSEECISHSGQDIYETARKIMTCFLHTDIYIIDYAIRPIKT